MLFSTRLILQACKRATEGERISIYTATEIAAEIYRKEIDRLFGHNCWPIGLKIKVAEPNFLPEKVPHIVTIDDLGQ